MHNNRTTYNGVKLGDFNVEKQDLLSDALKGTWIKKWESNVQLTVVRGHALLSSPIMETETGIQLSLPSHDPFYVLIKSLSGVRTELCSDSLTVTLNSGEQLEAVFTIKEVQNGIKH